MKQVVLVICDGWGYRKEKKYNAIAHAHTPNFDSLWEKYPHALLEASGEAIGLPKGQIGTSEANHLIIGSGRILYQNLLRINHTIKNDELAQNKALKEAFSHVKKFKSTLHIKGLASPGGVHSHIEHIKSLIKTAKDNGIKNVMLHLFTDGRDTSPKSAHIYIKDFEEYLKNIGVGRIASIGGRYWGMDRDNNHDRIEKHFRVLVVGKGPRYKTALEVIEQGHKKGIGDEFLEPSLIQNSQGEIGCIQPNDAIIFANFRADRAKQLTQRFLKEKIKNLKIVTMTQYADNLDVRVAFPPYKTINTLSEVFSRNAIRQLRVTETEKSTHLTFFFNAQKDKADRYEDRIMVSSNKDIQTHDQKPEMKVFEITDQVLQAINNKTHDFICVNLVNCDIVGHTANFKAIVKAVEAVDKGLGLIVKAARKNRGEVIVTADHGNAEETYDEKISQPITAHTLNPVPFILISEKYPKIKRRHGFLSDIAPTILKMFNLPVPKEMTGKTFI